LGEQAAAIEPLRSKIAERLNQSDGDSTETNIVFELKIRRIEALN